LINNNANVTFNFVPGKTYRVRLINMSALAMFIFSIDNHTMDIIEVEGVRSFAFALFSWFLNSWKFLVFVPVAIS
jgi:hypothetical protein